MKKLMFMFTVVAVAASVQAASMQWGIDKQAFKLSDGNSLPNNLTVYLLDTGATGYSTFTAGLADGSVTAANVTTEMAKYSGLLKDTKATKSSSTTTSTGMGKNYANIALQTITVSDLDSYYTVLAFDTSATDGSYLLSSSVRGIGYEGTDSSAGQAASFGSGQFASGWATPSGGGSDIPEPTSGILLLVGGAMLALRRKRA